MRRPSRERPAHCESLSHSSHASMPPKIADPVESEVEVLEVTGLAYLFRGPHDAAMQLCKSSPREGVIFSLPNGVHV